MSDLEQQSFANKPRNRRAIVKGAAWSVPVIAAAIAAPAASASVANASLSWTASDTSLLQLRLLDGSGSTLTAKVLMTVPTEFTLVNGPGAISGNATVTVTVGRPSGVNVTAGPARGFGVYSYNGVPTSVAERSVDYDSVIIVGDVGFPITTYTSTQAFNVPANGSFVVPVEFGLAGKSGILSIGALAAFPVTLTVDFGGGNIYSASTSVNVPVGAGVL